MHLYKSMPINNNHPRFQRWILPQNYWGRETRHALSPKKKNQSNGCTVQTRHALSLQKKTNYHPNFNLQLSIN